MVGESNQSSTGHRRSQFASQRWVEEEEEVEWNSTVDQRVETRKSGSVAGWKALRFLGGKGRRVRVASVRNARPQPLMPFELAPSSPSTR